MAGKVHRRGNAQQVKKLGRAHKRPCRSAPKTPTGLAVAFVKREVRNHELWRARVTFDAVTQDVADRTLDPERYDVQLRACDASGVPISIAGNDDDVQRESVNAGETPPKAVFENLTRPKTWYYQARVRTLNRVHGGKCFSGWTSWTTATQPSSGALPGPPAVTGLDLDFDKVEGTRRFPHRARVSFTEIGEWTPADGDAAEVVSYHVRLAVGPDGSATANVRHMYLPAGATHADFFGIRRSRFYRTSVQAVDNFGRVGAWSSWTAWQAIGGVLGPVRNLVWGMPTPAVFVAKWDSPANIADTDRFHVQVLRAAGGGTIVDDGFTNGNRWTYHIPVAHRGQGHRARVRAIAVEVSLDVDAEVAAGFAAEEESAEEESAETINTEVWGPDELDIPAIVDAVAPEVDPSDSTPPATVAGLTVVGGLKFLLAKWTADTATTDTVTYDVHMSPTTGFTPGPTNLVASVSATYAFLTALQDGTPLAYGTTYFVKVVARDIDGTAAASAQASGSLVKAVTADIAANAITVAEMADNAVTQAKLADDAVGPAELAALAVTTAKVAANAITTAKIAADAVTAGQLADDAVGTEHLQALAVTSAEVAASAITTAKIAADAVTAGEIAANAVGTSELNALAVTSAKIAALAVTTTELAADAVTAAKLADDAVGNEHIQALAVNSAEIAANAITTAKIIDDAVNQAKIAALSVGTGEIIALAVTAAQIAANTITAAKIAADTITAAEIAALAITTSELAAGAVTAAKITADTITANEIAASAITTSELAAGSVTAAKIVADTITAAEIAALAITTSELAAGAVTAVKIAAGTITANEIAAATITAAKIAADTITATEIAANAITTSELNALAVTAAKIAANTITAAEIAADAITTSELAAGAVTAGNILAGTIVAADIAANTITAGEIAASAITSSELAANAVIAGKILAGTIVAADIAADTITASQIAASAITTSELAALAVTAAKIAAATITATQIAVGTITANELAANSVTASELAALSVTAAKLEATLILASAIKTASSGQRLEFDTTGFRAYDGAGAETVNISSVSGSPTFAGEILTGGSPVLTAARGLSKCRCSYSAGGSLADGATRYIRFGTEERDTDGYHIPTTDGLEVVPSTGAEFTLPFDGDYLVTVACTYPNNSNGRRVISVYLNGVLYDSASTPAHPTTAMRFFPGPFWVTAVATDVIQIATIQATGGALNLTEAKVGIVYLGAS